MVPQVALNPVTVRVPVINPFWSFEARDEPSIARMMGLNLKTGLSVDPNREGVHSAGCSWGPVPSASGPIHKHIVKHVVIHSRISYVSHIVRLHFRVPLIPVKVRANTHTCREASFLGALYHGTLNLDQDKNIVKHIVMIL